MTTAACAKELRLSHQWSTNDIRHKVAQIVADEVAKANVDLEIKIFPSKLSVQGTRAVQAAVGRPARHDRLSAVLCRWPAAEYNLTLMPGLVKNHDHAARLNNSEFMQEIEKLMAEDDVRVVVHGYLAGGFASKDNCITKPDHVKGLQTRAAGKAFEEMLAAAGASIASMASSEVYSAMQSGVLNAVNTSSSSFVSFRLYEQVKCYTPAGDVALWFMYQPLLMNKSAYDGLNDEQKKALDAAAAKAEAYYLEEAKKEDAASVEVFQKAGVEIANMTPEEFKMWQDLAKESSYKKFIENAGESGQRLLDMALSVE